VATAGLGNVHLITADIASTGLTDGSADAVISNCVINLCPDKQAVYQEAFHLLRPQGPLAVSDIVLAGSIEPALAERLRMARLGCLAGAEVDDAYLATIVRAGFTDIRIVARHQLDSDELEAMALCPGPSFSPPVSRSELEGVTGKVVSLKFTAVKPASRRRSPDRSGPTAKAPRHR